MKEATEDEDAFVEILVDAPYFMKFGDTLNFAYDNVHYKGLTLEESDAVVISTIPMNEPLSGTSDVEPYLFTATVTPNVVNSYLYLSEGEMGSNVFSNYNFGANVQFSEDTVTVLTAIALDGRRPVIVSEGSYDYELGKTYTIAAVVNPIDSTYSLKIKEDIEPVDSFVELLSGIPYFTQFGNTLGFDFDNIHYKGLTLIDSDVELISSIPMNTPLEGLVEDKNYTFEATVTPTVENSYLYLSEGEMGSNVFSNYNFGANIQFGGDNVSTVLSGIALNGRKPELTTQGEYAYELGKSYDIEVEVNVAMSSYSLSIKAEDEPVDSFVQLVSDIPYFVKFADTLALSLDNIHYKGLTLEDVEVSPYTSVAVELPTNEEFYVTATITTQKISSKFYFLEGEKLAADMSNMGPNLLSGINPSTRTVVMKTILGKDSVSKSVYSDVIMDLGFDFETPYEVEFFIDPINNTYSFKARIEGDTAYTVIVEDQPYFANALSMDSELTLTHYDAQNLTVDNFKVTPVSSIPVNMPIEGIVEGKNYTLTATVTAKVTKCSLFLSEGELNSNNLFSKSNFGPNLQFGDDLQATVITALKYEGLKPVLETTGQYLYEVGVTYDVEFKVDADSYTYSLWIKKASESDDTFVQIITDMPFFVKDVANIELALDNIYYKGLTLDDVNVVPVTSEEIELPTDQKYIFSATIQEDGRNAMFYLMNGEEMLSDYSNVGPAVMYSGMRTVLLQAFTGLDSLGSPVLEGDFATSFGKKYDVEYHIDPILYTYTLMVKENGTEGFVTVVEDQAYFTNASANPVTENMFALTHYDANSMIVENVTVTPITSVAIALPSDSLYILSAKVTSDGYGASFSLMNGEMLDADNYSNIGPNLSYTMGAGRKVLMNTKSGMDTTGLVYSEGGIDLGYDDLLSYDVQFHVNPMAYTYTLLTKLSTSADFDTIVVDQPYFIGADSLNNEIALTHYYTDMLMVENLMVTIVEPSAINRVEVIGLSIYPNPATEFINVTYDGQIVAAKLYNLRGVAVRSVVNAGTSDIRFDVADLKSGMYILSIKTEEGITTRPIMKR